MRQAFGDPIACSAQARCPKCGTLNYYYAIPGNVAFAKCHVCPNRMQVSARPTIEPHSIQPTTGRQRFHVKQRRDQ